MADRSDVQCARTSCGHRYGEHVEAGQRRPCLVCPCRGFWWVPAVVGEPRRG